MGKVRYVWACSCGAETFCGPKDMESGAVWRCPTCETVFGCVRPQRGGRAWVTIDPQEVKFHELIREPRKRRVKRP